MNVRINQQTFPVERLSSDEDKLLGMGGRDSLDGCMLFDMGFGYHSFWMKDCKIPLDIVFLNKNKISRIHNNCEPCDICDKKYTGLGDKVLEFPGGTAQNWKINDEVYFY
jgi:uncharacterized membrane protein (UPF0127 family)